MRRLLLVPLLALSLNVFASNTLRVGQQVLSVGDTAVHTIDLLGTPVYKESVENALARTRASAGNTAATRAMSSW